MMTYNFNNIPSPLLSLLFIFLTDQTFNKKTKLLKSFTKEQISKDFIKSLRFCQIKRAHSRNKKKFVRLFLRDVSKWMRHIVEAQDRRCITENNRCTEDGTTPRPEFWFWYPKWRCKRVTASLLPRVTSTAGAGWRILFSSY
jgi:hypothetical protein